MKFHRTARLIPLAAFLALFGATTAHATVITMNLLTEFSGGAAPANAYTATFDDTACGVDCVRLTMGIVGSDTGEFIDGAGTNFGWGFNLDPTKSVSSLAFAFVSGNNADNISASTDAFKADGDGFYDFVFGWNAAPGSRFVAGQTSVYDITGITGLTANDFNFLSLCAQGCGNGPWLSAAHVQGIGPNDALSGWIGASPNGGPPPQEIPEPAPLALLGLGLTGLWAIRRRRAA